MAPPASHSHVPPMPDRPGQTLGQRLLPQRTIRTDVRQAPPRRPAHDLDFLQRLREAGL